MRQMLYPHPLWEALENILGLSACQSGFTLDSHIIHEHFSEEKITSPCALLSLE